MPHIGADNIVSNTGQLKNVKSAEECGVVSGKYEFDKESVLRRILWSEFALKDWIE